MEIVKLRVSRTGRKIGEAHHNAKISDRLVQKLRDLNENWGLGWRRLSAQFELSPNTVKAILNFRRRNTIFGGYRKVERPPTVKPAPQHPVEPPTTGMERVRSLP